MDEGRLVDGELKFGDGTDEDEEAQGRDPSLVEGGYLTQDLADEIPNELLGKPLDEIDPNLHDKVRVKKGHLNK